MVTMDRRARVPVFDENGDLVYYVIDAPPTHPDQKLRLGTHPQGHITMESQLRQHKKQLGYKEPATTTMECQICKKHIPRTHATQKYCVVCGKVQKRLKTKLRKQRQRQRNKDEAKHEGSN